MKTYNFAIVGATGMVGQHFIKVLEERNLPIKHIFFFASSRSAGSTIRFQGNEYPVEELNERSFEREIDIALFSAGGSISATYAPIAKRKGIVVIDNSSHWRMDPTVPLVVPEVNPEDIRWHSGIIANPNCSTIQAVVALKPLHDKYSLKRVIYSTYQAVSGAGMQGHLDLQRGINGEPNTKFPHPIAHNVIPHIDVFLENGYTKEEVKMIEETRKILHLPSLKVTATTVRVPVYNGHSESINVEFERDFLLPELTEVLTSAPGIVVEDNTSTNQYPMPSFVSGKDDVYVGRIRRDESVNSGINLWVVADNIRKGAATNAVQIAEKLIDWWTT